MKGFELLPDGPGLTRFEDLVSRGRTRIGSRDAHDRDVGISALLDAARRVNVGERDHEGALRLLASACATTERPRLAHAIAVFLRDATLVRSLDAHVLPRDRARAKLAGVSTSGPERLLVAAEELESDARLVGAARAFERAEAWARARALWSRLATNLTHTASRYETALAWLNVVRTSQRLGDERELRRASDLVVEHAEEASDGFLRGGERERAFDALDVLVALGKRTKLFEHAMLGYVGRARILREDRLTTFSTATFEEAIAHAREAGENAAAADLARELAELARADGDRALYARARREEADSSRMAALEEGRPDSLTEPMLLSAARAYADAGQLRSVGAVYAELGRRAATAARREYFARSAARYEGQTDPPRTRATTTDARPASVDLFHVDLAEWEGAGSAAEAAAEVLQDPACAEVTRRRALYVQLAGLLTEPEIDVEPRAGAALATAIAPLEIYAMLSPLEHLARSPHEVVRNAVADALAHFTFKRTFSIVRTLAADPRIEATLAASVERLSFAHGIDPLLRLARAGEGPVSRAALIALAEIAHPDAGEVLFDYVVAGGDEERRRVASVLETHPSASLRSAATRATTSLDPTRRGIAATLSGK